MYDVLVSHHVALFGDGLKQVFVKFFEPVELVHGCVDFDICSRWDQVWICCERFDQVEAFELAFHVRVDFGT